ncbi:MAG: amidohydrolase family protein [Ignavibacteria bacterium]|nr:amidohydrolase family protein [Ignavibacteria bacterium]
MRRKQILCAQQIVKVVVTVALCILVSTYSAAGSDQIPAKPQDHTIALVGGTIHKVVGPSVEGTIVFDGGKIIDLGANATIPEVAEIIDVSGKHIYPGLISADTYIGLIEIGAVRATRDRTETGDINPNIRAEVAVNPESELIPVARANGITMMVTSPSGGLISGTSAMMMMDGWTWEEMTFKAPAAMYVSWPRMTIITAPWFTRSEEEQKNERDKSLQELKDAFRNARAYMTAKKAEAQEDVPYHDVDMRWEAMIPVLERTVPVVVWATEVQQIQAAVAWAEQENIRIIIGGGYDAWRVADLLKKKNIPVLAGGIHRLPMRRFEAYDESFVLPAKLHDAGIQFAIITRGSPASERNLPYHAAMAAAYGLPKEEALKAITLYPAQIFGVADRIGSLEVGKDATLIVTTGDPLEIINNVEMEFIQGRKIDLTSRHTMLYEKYKEKYRRTKE